MPALRSATTTILTLALLGLRPHIGGAFALQAARARSQAYLTARPLAGDALMQRLDLWFARPSDERPIETFDVDMTKRLHVVIVSDDFQTFLHVHPRLGSDGHFRIEQRFPRAATYYVYAEAEPREIGKQVFRFTLPVGAHAVTAARPRIAPTGATASAGPYTVNLDGTRLRAGCTSALTVHIRRDGRPATDLHPYLGALAHAVFLNAHDLSYVHVHPMPLRGETNPKSGMASMDAMAPLPEAARSAPDMRLHVAVAEAGTYKLWLQFRGGGTLRVAPFVLTAEQR